MGSGAGESVAERAELGRSLQRPEELRVCTGQIFPDGEV
jgi:hypothetical protein